MGLNTPGEPNPNYGNLVPVSIDNSKSTVQELRYEPFTIHNWQINDRMSLESRLLYETSTIEQKGDVSRERSFSFVKPKIDYRYNLTQSFQVRLEIERDISQLSFSDFSASVEVVDFHVKWSEDMRLLFPAGSEASTSNGSDASSDIWRNTSGFEKQIRQYNLISLERK